MTHNISNFKHYQKLEVPKVVKMGDHNA